MNKKTLKAELMAEAEKMIDEKLRGIKSEESKGLYPMTKDYCYIGINGNLYCQTWENDNFDNYLYKTKNIYETKAEAQRALECKNIMADLSYDFSLEELADEKIVKFEISAYFCGKNLEIHSFFVCRISNYMFKTEEKAQEAINRIGFDDYVKYILGVRK